MNYCYYIFTPKGVNYFLQYLLLIFFRGQAPEAVANLVWSIFFWWSQINDIQKMLALQNKLQSNRIDMKGVIQEYQETQRTAEVSEKKQAFLQDFKEMITEAIRALKSDTEWAELDLSKYFDTLNHEILMNLLRRNVKDERVVQLIKRYLKSGVMENGVVIETEEGSPQGGNLSPLLANIYLNEFDQEFLKRGVPCIRYADDIVLLAKSKRASERLLESSMKYLEEKLKLTVNREKSRTVSVFAIRNFKFLGFA